MTLSPELGGRHTEDSRLVVSAIDGLLEEVDFGSEFGFSSGTIGGLNYTINRWKDGSILANFKDGSTDIASFNKDRPQSEGRYELTTVIPVSESPATMQVMTNVRGDLQLQAYFLREERVGDEPRIQVVRKALGLESS
jgi:hypothetical protein